MQGKAFYTEMQFVQGMAFLPDDEILGKKLISINLLWQTQNWDTQMIEKIGRRRKRMKLNFGYRNLRRYGIPVGESRIRLTIFLTKFVWRHVLMF